MSSTGGEGGRSNFKCKVLLESGFPLFSSAIAFRKLRWKNFLQNYK